MALQLQDTSSSAGVTSLRSASQRVREAFTAKGIFAVVVTVLILYLVLGPVLMLFVSSGQLTTNSLPLSDTATWSLENYKSVFGSSHTWGSLRTTLVFSGGAVLVAGVLSIALAWLVECSDIPMRRTLYILIVATAGIPGLVYAISWSLLLNPNNGVVNQALDAVVGFKFDVVSLPGMILVEGLRLVPLTFLLISPAFRRLNSSFEDAGATSGASPFAVMRRVTLPLLAPALLAALIYNWVSALQDLDVPLVLGLPGDVTVLSTQVYLSVAPLAGLPNYGLSSAYGLLLFALSIVPLLFYWRIIRQSNNYATMGGKGHRSRRASLGKWRFPILLVTLGYIFVVLVLPLLIVFWASIQPYYAGFSMSAIRRITFKGYGTTFDLPSLSSTISNTLIVALVVATITTMLSVAASWLIVRSKSRRGTILDFFAYLPHVIPSVVVGLTILLIYLTMPFPFVVYGTIWIIAIALVTKYVAVGTRLTTPGVTQLSVSLEEAVYASGGRLRHVWGRVLLPLLRPVMTNTFLVVFIFSVHNLTLALMFFSSKSQVISTTIYNNWSHGDVVGTTVLSLLVTILTVGVVSALHASDR
jgi:iron(III) transport system permease protein